MVSVMPPGSVIVDLAAERGGNCELTRAGEIVVHHGVSVIGPTNLPSRAPHHASQMYGSNVVAFLKLLIKDGAVNVNLDDEIIRDTLVTHKKEVVNARVSELLSTAAAPK
jgi:NAD(P) transhydrogenase subunit alpha